MSLLDEYKVEFVRMIKAVVPDGEGGYITEYYDGEEFAAAITVDKYVEAIAADKLGNYGRYIITISRETKLEYDNIIKRKDDNKGFRIVSGEIRTPKSSSLDMKQYRAEEFEL